MLDVSEIKGLFSQILKAADPAVGKLDLDRCITVTPRPNGKALTAELKFSSGEISLEKACTEAGKALEAATGIGFSSNHGQVLDYNNLSHNSQMTLSMRNDETSKQELGEVLNLLQTREAEKPKAPEPKPEKPLIRQIGDSVTELLKETIQKQTQTKLDFPTSFPDAYGVGDGRGKISTSTSWVKADCPNSTVGVRQMENILYRIPGIEDIKIQEYPESGRMHCHLSIECQIDQNTLDKVNSMRSPQGMQAGTATAQSQEHSSQIHRQQCGKKSHS